MDQEENLSRSVFRSISDGLVVVDQSGVVVELNAAAAYALNVTAKEVQNQNFKGKLNNSVLESELSEITKSPDVYSIKRFEIQTDGHTFAVNFDPIFETAEKRIGILVVLHDVTEERKLLATKDEFLYSASHELYTPLTELRWNLESLRDEAIESGNEEWKVSTADAYSGFQHIFKIATDLLDITSVETGRGDFSTTSFDLTKAVSDALEKVAVSAHEKKIQIKLESENASARGDEKKTVEIIEELLENAIKFSDDGTITVKVKSGAKPTIEIIDQGIGIDSTKAEQLFTKFGRLGEILEDHRGGLGLGLYKAKLYADGMGAILRLASSEVGKGSTFVLELLTAE